MVTRIGGARRKTRGLMKKQHRSRGKLSLRNYLQEFSAGDKVALVMEPAVQKGTYHRRHYGKVGEVLRTQGSCYVIGIRDGGKVKEVIAHPVHLRKV